MKNTFQKESRTFKVEMAELGLQDGIGLNVIFFEYEDS